MSILDFHADQIGRLVHTSKIGGYLQKTVAVLIRQRILFVESYLQIAGHTGE